jgi:iron complex transport system substrate-binding protein
MTESWPARIVCLTEETTETLYLLGEDWRIVGVSGYTVRPPAARSKTKVSSFISAKYEKIIGLKPDLVLTFSDLQADIAAELIRRGVEVLAFNQRSVAEILRMIQTLGRIIGCADKAELLVGQFEAGLAAIRNSAARFPHRPRVFFEEWNDPLISGIRWVDELIEIAGGETLFPELRACQAAKDRILDPVRVAARDPEVIIASWCGRPVRKNLIRRRPGWEQLSALRHDFIYEVKSTYILQPGPAALTEGARQLHAILAHCVGLGPEADCLPLETMDRDLRKEISTT